ncbi:hypothetical protein GW17_00002359 [Ensete ventricosum]|nr:hypothetical protein GW17_00002359 [Ensete ventricosum]
MWSDLHTQEQLSRIWSSRKMRGLHYARRCSSRPGALPSFRVDLAPHRVNPSHCYESTLVWENSITAGTDTSSSTVEWALAELTHHSDVAQLELDSVVGRSHLVSESDLPSLSCKPSSRGPPAQAAFPPPHGVGGVRGLPTLLVDIWGDHPRPGVVAGAARVPPGQVFPGGRHESVDVKGKDFNSSPSGPRDEPGVQMVQTMAATLVHGFDWRLPAGMRQENLDMEEAYGFTLQRAAPLMAYPVPRLVPAAYEGRC